uniref:ATP synthase complex subunit 8 n=1 Tax=Capnogryllacris melanocrania TaxID=1945529 RepID=A0A1Q1MPQ8_9ORTH|nr:ATP synthase F0 subunit 8 [Capnogryllacris melanocrania]
MPQMAPLSWLLLFFIFTSTLILFAVINYYYFLPLAPSSKETSIMKSTLNWKW